MSIVARVWPKVDAVVVGASAGGVDALLSLLPHWRAGGPVLLLALHRAARQADGGSLAELLARVCPAPVADAWSGQPLRRGDVVLAPADYHLLIDRGPVAALSVDEPVLWSRPAIDPLFDSAAAVFGPRLLGIVLTGASADGSAGARTLREAGGELWVQQPDEATADVMPRAALDLAGADRVLTLHQMAQAFDQLELLENR